MATVTFDDVTIAVAGSIVLRDVAVEIADGEFIGVIGPSGSGKSSLIRTIAGFTEVIGGRLLFDGRDVTTARTADRDVGMVFQDPVLFTTRNVERNVSFPLELRHQHIHEIRRRVDAEVRAMHIEHLLLRNPHQLSRGEAQLVQIARALVRTPRVLLLDEPLASLDAALQTQMRKELSMLQAGYGVTTVMSTNDPVETLTMPDRVVVLDGGRVVQVDTPQRIQQSPASIGAAVGTGECWLLPATVEADQDGFWLTVRSKAQGTLRSEPILRHRAWTPSLADHVDREVTIGIRPADVISSPSGRVDAVILRVIPGTGGSVLCDVGGWRVGARIDQHVRAGDAVTLQIAHVAVFDAATGRAIR